MMKENLSRSRESDTEPNKMTLIDFSRCILCASVIRHLVMFQQLEEPVLVTQPTCDSCPAVLLMASGLQFNNLVLTALINIPVSPSLGMSS
jgi:hypothetical protein